ncbi:MAG: hypothetical protein M8866_10160 [marine benthic group bacterium]|jgi:hypothetical protein|nr:hypothetical protein [Candidatus Benthicola marisminoris]
MRGYKVLALGLSAVVAFTFTACDEQPTEPEAQASEMSFAKGNGFPPGAHDYKLNIIGVPKDKSADMDGNNGRRIFVQLNGGETVTNGGGKWKPGKSWDDLNKVNKILLMPGEFGVADANATDSDGALFYLPDPNTGDGPEYSVFARALGTPGGYATLTTCADEDGDGFDDSDDVWCGSNGVTLTRNGKKPRAVNVTENLLKLVISVDPDTDPELSVCLGGSGDTPDFDDPAAEFDVWLFDACFENYFWNYDNHGLKLLELRFYAN